MAAPPSEVLTDIVAPRSRSVLAPPLALGGAMEARWAFVRIAIVFLVARAIVLACAIGVETLAPPDAAGPGGSVRLATDRPILASLTGWDGVYYLGIAADGYQPGPVNGPYPEVVFFPLYPALIRVVAPVLGGDLALAAVVIANVAAFAALFVVYRAARSRLAPQAALLATTVVALQPGAVALSMAYSDGLFLLFAIGSMLCADRGSRTAAAILALLAGLTRPQGILLVVPLLLIYLRQDGPRPRLSWLGALAPALGIGAFGLAMWQLTGDPIAPLTAQAAWDFGGVPDIPPEPWVLAIAGIIYGGTILIALRLLVDQWGATRRGGRWGAGVPVMAWTLLNIAVIAAARRLQSLPRYLVPVTLLAEGVASGRYGRRWVTGVLGASVVAYTVLAILHFSLRLAP
ncbi:MAG: glycosyltransferase family 39 protein [Chloroflexi bacterium]|nr:glycosyltransferase family 39 protein [Chloroflexota bacterium]